MNFPDYRFNYQASGECLSLAPGKSPSCELRRYSLCDGSFLKSIRDLLGILHNGHNGPNHRPTGPVFPCQPDVFLAYYSPYLECPV